MERTVWQWLEEAPRGAALALACAALLVVPLGLVGCGGGDESTTSAEGQPPTGSPDRSAAKTSTGSAEPNAAKSPDGRSAKQVKPTADPDAGSAAPAPTSAPESQLPAAAADAARELGRRACEGMTPLEAANHFELPARAAGVDKKFAKFVAEPPSSTVNSPGYPQ